MKRSLRIMLGSGAVLLVLAAAMYSQRTNLSDLIARTQAPDLPEPVGYEEVVERIQVGEDVEIIRDVDSDEPVDEPNDDPPPTPSVPLDSPDAPADPEVPDALSPASINLAIPFTSQAPHAVWDELHEETCEEASIYMAAAYYRGEEGTIDRDVAEAELQRLVALEMEMFGQYFDTTAAETAELIARAYGMRAEVVENPTAADIKGHLAAGHPVIVPAAGQMLGNPNFTGDGPPYHMFVLRGYADGSFIANDPGTRLGAEYLYSEATLMAAIHDWTGDHATIGTGAKRVLVVYPE